MAFPMPLVVPKSRSVNLGGGAMSASRTTLGAEISAQSAADIHSMLVGITSEDTAEQIRIGNPPQLLEVDNRTNKPLTQVTARVVVLFGTVLARAAMRMVETELRQAIARSTTPRSGRLLNISGSWEWRYIQAGRAPRVVTSANPPTSFSRGDKLVLVPAHVPYASAVNRAVANSGRLNAYTGTKGRKGTPPKSAQNLGFLAATTRAVKRRSEFKQFVVMVEHTTRHAVPGEGRKHGTGVITIRPRFKQVRV